MTPEKDNNVSSANQTPGGYKFAPLVANQLWRANQPEHTCFKAIVKYRSNDFCLDEVVVFRCSSFCRWCYFTCQGNNQRHKQNLPAAFCTINTSDFLSPYYYITWYRILYCFYIILQINIPYPLPRHVRRITSTLSTRKKLRDSYEHLFSRDSNFVWSAFLYKGIIISCSSVGKRKHTMYKVHSIGFGMNSSALYLRFLRPVVSPLCFGVVLFSLFYVLLSYHEECVGQETCIQRAPWGF